MEAADEPAAWLEQAGQHYLLDGNCSIGRASINTIVVDSPKVSRLHAITHSDGRETFWLIDPESSNGTFLNERRIHEPVRLHDKDHMLVGGSVFTFRQPEEMLAGGKTTLRLPTVQEGVADVPCWLLVADIKNFTPLSRQLESSKLAEFELKGFEGNRAFFAI